MPGAWATNLVYALRDGIKLEEGYREPTMRILIADDQAEVRSALRLLIEQDSELVVAGEAEDVIGLITEAIDESPDLVLLDWELPALQRPAALIAALRGLAQSRIIVLSGRPEARQQALAAGADEFISKGDSPEGLLATLLAIHARNKNENGEAK